MRPVALAQRKSHAELWVELCELVQAGKFLVSADAGAHIEGNAGLMPGGAALDDETGPITSSGQVGSDMHGMRGRTGYPPYLLRQASHVASSRWFTRLSF